MSNRAQVLTTVSRLVIEVIGEEWAESVEMTESTTFNDDLELESIEFVALAERLQDEYGSKVDFVAWISSKELDDIIHLSLGDVVSFITESLNS